MKPCCESLQKARVSASRALLSGRMAYNQLTALDVEMLSGGRSGVLVIYFAHLSNCAHIAETRRLCVEEESLRR